MHTSQPQNQVDLITTECDTPSRKLWRANTHKTITYTVKLMLWASHFLYFSVWSFCAGPRHSRSGSSSCELLWFARTLAVSFFICSCWFLVQFLIMFVFVSRLRRDVFGVESYQRLKHWYSSGLPCQAPGVIGSALGLVGPVSVYCDWVRWKVWSATCISVWQHVKLSEQIRPWDTLACCWDVKQPTNKQLSLSDHNLGLFMYKQSKLN